MDNRLVHFSWKNFLLQQIRENPGAIFIIIIALILMGAAQSGLLIVIGPLLKIFAGAEAYPPTIKLIDLFSGITVPRIFLPFLEFSFSTKSLVFGLPSALIGFGIIRCAANLMFETYQARFALTVATSFRIMLFDHLLALGYAKISERSPAQWMSMLINDVSIFQSRLSEVVITLVRDSVLVVFCLIVLFLLYWPVALGITLALPIIVWILGRIGRSISRYAEMWQREQSLLVNTVLDIRMRFEFLKAQIGEANELSRFKTINERYYQNIRKSLLLRGAFAPGVELFGFIVFSLLLAAFVNTNSAHIALEGTTVLQFFAALGLLVRPLRNWGEQLARAQEMLGTLKASFSVLQENIPPQRSHDAGSMHISLPDSLRIERVTFKTERKFSLDIQDCVFTKSKIYAIAGSSGAGKSTLLKILGGLLEPSHWQASTSHNELTYLSNYVSQTPFLFSASIRDNLLYGLTTSVKDETIISVLRSLGLGEMFDGLKGGLSMQFQQFTKNLSGGQAQRLSVARALFRDKPLFLLDEATSALDQESESLVLNVIQKQCTNEGKIALFVTHRVQSLAFFDHVIFMESGTVAAQGTHEELLKNPTYHRFLKHQRGQL